MAYVGETTPEVHVKLSKLLSNLLRHVAEKVKVEIDKVGWVTLKAALEYVNHGPNGVHDEFMRFNELNPVEERRRYTDDDIKELVNSAPTKRFELRFDTPLPMIRAIDGHTMKDVAKGHGLRLVVEKDEVQQGESTVACPFAIHCTYLEALDGENGILKRGLSAMSRNYVHLVKSVAGDEGRPSELRADCSAFIWLDVLAAIREGCALPSLQPQPHLQP